MGIGMEIKWTLRNMNIDKNKIRISIGIDTKIKDGHTDGNKNKIEICTNFVVKISRKCVKTI